MSPMSIEELAGLITRSLKHSRAVEIDGLGIFVRDSSGQISFRDSNHPRVFIAYAVEDAAQAEQLFKALSARGFAAWLDRRKLLPGQNWPRRIEDAIAGSGLLHPLLLPALGQEKRRLPGRDSLCARLRYPRAARSGLHHSGKAR